MLEELIGELIGAVQPHIVEFVSNHPLLGASLALLGSLVVFGQALVAATPTDKDDAFLRRLEGKPLVGSLLKMLKSFAPKNKK